MINKEIAKKVIVMEGFKNVTELRISELSPNTFSYKDKITGATYSYKVTKECLDAIGMSKFNDGTFISIKDLMITSNV